MPILKNFFSKILLWLTFMTKSFTSIKNLFDFRSFVLWFKNISQQTRQKLKWQHLTFSFWRWRHSCFPRFLVSKCFYISKIDTIFKKPIFKLENFLQQIEKKGRSFNLRSNCLQDFVYTYICHQIVFVSSLTRKMNMGVLDSDFISFDYMQKWDC